MRSQFDELAKALAQGASRRRVLRAALGGLVGGIAVTILPGSRSETVDANTPAANPPVRQGTDVNQRPPSLNQAGSQPSAGRSLNQAPVRPSQSSARLNQARRDPRALLNQFVQNRPGTTLNQTRRRFNQQSVRLNQHLPALNQSSARLNQARARLNQQRVPFWNQTRPR